ncbi:MAG: glucose-phosphate adenylyltransferase [Nocardioidaceae bacterium]|jgi:glucose-1-phosphate adenylyltransferase|nr:glucose-phosphate adenylyltransferase [Nocardioidaceae bacterium]
MSLPRILAIVQAGGAGGRMDVLTRERAKPALPFAGVYQLVDFPLSNLAHSDISDVWLSLQYQGNTLEDAVANGRPWDLDRTRGGLRLLMPQQGTGSDDEEGFARGNADELYRIRDQIRSADPDVVVVLSADHVYRFDYREAVRTHRDQQAECTIVTSEVDLAEAGEHATVESDGDGRVTGFAYKPEEPTTGTVATEIFLYDARVLVPVLEELHRERSWQAEGGDSGLGDFGESLVPRFVDRGRAVVHALPGYWRDLGQPHHYLAAHQDILVEDQGLFDDPSWPILTRQPQRVPARVLSGGSVEDSLVAPGGRVRGRVVRSVLGPGVVVEEGAVVCNSVLFADSVVERGARVDWAIVDQGALVAADTVVGHPDADGTGDPAQVTIVGRDSVVGDSVGAGARLEPGTT